MQKRKSSLRKITSLLLVLTIFGAWCWFELETHTPINVDGGKLAVVDGDSFSDGVRRFRLDGIDAPEYRQTCADASGAVWECGKASRASLERMLRLPDLTCAADATDQYGRSIATCSTATIPDIGAAQVIAGMAVTHEYFGVRNYGDEEDSARDARRGIWVGKFMQPAEWRASYATLRTNTVPAE